MRFSPQRWAIIAAAATGIQTGAAIVGSRYAMQEFSPIALTVLRYTFGFLCLLPWVAASLKALLSKNKSDSIGGNGMPLKDLLGICALGIGQFGLLIVLLNMGLKTVPAGRAALLFATLPMMTMMLAVVLSVEKLSLHRSLGVALSFGAVFLALLSKDSSMLPFSDKIAQGVNNNGDILVLASALVGALCGLGYRPYLRKYPALPLSALAMLASVLVLLPFALTQGMLQQVANASSQAALAVLFIGASSAFGYFCWLWALAHAEPTLVSVFLALSPITATFLGWVSLGEPVPLLFLLALVCAVVGLYLSTRPSKVA